VHRGTLGGRQQREVVLATRFLVKVNGYPRILCAGHEVPGIRIVDVVRTTVHADHAVAWQEIGQQLVKSREQKDRRTPPSPWSSKAICAPLTFIVYMVMSLYCLELTAVACRKGGVHAVRP
jgi:hypothetical protein